MDASSLSTAACRGVASSCSRGGRKEADTVTTSTTPAPYPTSHVGFGCRVSPHGEEQAERLEASVEGSAEQGCPAVLRGK